MNEVLVLVLFGSTVQVELLYPLNRQFLVSKRNFIGVRSKFPGIPVHMGGKSRGEEDHLDILWQ